MIGTLGVHPFGMTYDWKTHYGLGFWRSRSTKVAKLRRKGLMDKKMERILSYFSHQLRNRCPLMICLPMRGRLLLRREIRNRDDSVRELDLVGWLLVSSEAKGLRRLLQGLPKAIRAA
ncbi:unnamed protein product [Dovyalis caffra]|uniref:Ribosomal protein S14 n=1 Tax=Dovyalis caffra TaxID=77055 RepID=A0AAV1QQ67_9ROSI|nr:unnamed protein product [Dovyalis caffra]